MLCAAVVVGASLSPGPNGLFALTYGGVYDRHKSTFPVFVGVSVFLAAIVLHHQRDQHLFHLVLHRRGS